MLIPLPLPPLGPMVVVVVMTHTRTAAAGGGRGAGGSGSGWGCRECGHAGPPGGSVARPLFLQLPGGLDEGLEHGSADGCEDDLLDGEEGRQVVQHVAHPLLVALHIAEVATNGERGQFGQVPQKGKVRVDGGPQPRRQTQQRLSVQRRQALHLPALQHHIPRQVHTQPQVTQVGALEGRVEGVEWWEGAVGGPAELLQLGEIARGEHRNGFPVHTHTREPRRPPDER
mmetsp:Transcript_6451/g.15592  ORF Transcript_6451/g.15592 Transcript_6451/m.15592 type:complete len:228 (+) Transcript_6451:428-1111(+)